MRASLGNRGSNRVDNDLTEKVTYRKMLEEGVEMRL